MKDEAVMRELLQRMAEDPLGRLPATGLTEREDRLCDLLEDRKLVAWVNSYPYGYRITAAGFDALSHEDGDDESSGPRPEPWRSHGVTLEEGTALRIVAHGKIIQRGEVRRGRLAFGAAAWLAPSPAAEWAVGRTEGVFRSRNGWMYVEALVGDKWRTLADLRAGAVP